jgi:hypothetical protein
MVSEQEQMAVVALRSGYVFLIALTLAYLEVQIEGSNGWASALPTWRSLDHRWTWLAGGRPITGYHVALNLLLLLFLHWPFAFTRWTGRAEFTVLQTFAILAVIWDYLWFIVNPAYGPARFFARDVWWYRRWTASVPSEYWLGLLVSALLGWASCRQGKGGGGVAGALRVGVELGVPIVLAIVATAIRWACSR